MTDFRHFKKICQVSCFRENVPADPTKFNVQRFNDQIQITDLRIEFKVDRTLTKTPDSCDITITNLSRDTRSLIERKPLNVEIAAGYDGEARLMFAGDLRFGMTKLKHPNWETLLQLGDGDCHHRWARVNRSYSTAVTVRQVLTDTARSMGLVLPTNLANDKSLDSQFAAGQVAMGAARDKLTQLLAPYGYHWSVQNGKLQVLRDEDVHSLSPIPIDEAHGMIGTPEFGSPPRSGKPPHMTVRTLLYPELLPGNLIQLTSIVKSGLFRIEHVKHEGDTHGPKWETEIEIKPYATPSATAPTPTTNPVLAAVGDALAAGLALGGVSEE